MTEQTFISEARRAQIAQATIATLDEIGFVNASLAQIAKRAGISTALISYHFQNKDDLMSYTLVSLLQDVAAFVQQRTEAEEGNRQKLRAYIEASLAYRAKHPAHYVALLEIIFNARTPEGVPYYKIEDEDDEEPLVTALQRILAQGQESGEFRDFHIQVMAHTIQGAIWEYVTNSGLVTRIDMATYGQELVSVFERAVLAEKGA